MTAGLRCLAAAQIVGCVALLIDAKDERAAAWYLRQGGLALLDHPLSILLPLDTVRQAAEGAGLNTPS